MPYPGTNVQQYQLPGDPATTDGIVANTWPDYPLDTSTFSYNGAVGLEPETATLISIYDIAEGTAAPGKTVYVQTNTPTGLSNGQTVYICGTGTYTAAPGPPLRNGYRGAQRL